MLKTLAWGKDKETLIQTYKAIGRPIANYAAPIFAPQLCQTNWQLIQRPQNAALRIITGCHKMSHKDHLHQETNILRVKEHTVMLAAQYAYKCHHPLHPNFELTHPHICCIRNRPQLPGKPNTGMQTSQNQLR